MTPCDTTGSVDLNMQQGVPYARRVRLIDGKTIWATLDSFEVRAQVRQNARASSTLVYDLTPHLTPAFDGNDIIVDIILTGAQTRLAVGGHYDLFISDIGTTDSRAIRMLFGMVNVKPSVTTAVGA